MYTHIFFVYSRINFIICASIDLSIYLSIYIDLSIYLFFLLLYINIHMYVISMSNFCFQEEVRLAREEASLSAERAHMAEVAAQSETGGVS